MNPFTMRYRLPAGSATSHFAPRSAAACLFQYPHLVSQPWPDRKGAALCARRIAAAPNASFTIPRATPTFALRTPTGREEPEYAVRTPPAPIPATPSRRARGVLNRNIPWRNHRRDMPRGASPRLIPDSPPRPPRLASTRRNAAATCIDRDSRRSTPSRTPRADAQRPLGSICSKETPC